MGRPPDPERRQELLESVVEYVLKNGLTGLSLRPLANGVGTSARMLLYHFESREKLLALRLKSGFREAKEDKTEQWARVLLSLQP